MNATREGKKLDIRDGGKALRHYVQAEGTRGGIFGGKAGLLQNGSRIECSSPNGGRACPLK